MPSHPRECYIHANALVFAQWIVNVYVNCTNEFSILYECLSINAIFLLVGVIEVYFDVNDYKVPAQNVWARIYLSVNVIEYRYSHIQIS